jgi:hypothetical protein
MYVVFNDYGKYLGDGINLTKNEAPLIHRRKMEGLSLFVLKKYFSWS